MKKVVSSAPEAGLTGSFRPSIQSNGNPVPMSVPQTIVPGPVLAGINGTQSQQLAQMGIPMMPGMPLPQGGQTITVNMNAPSPHLPFWQWVGRGIVAGVGHAAAFPFLIMRDVTQQAVKFIFKAVGILLIPTLLMAGCQLRYLVERANSGEKGAQTVIEQGRHVLRGLKSGAESDLDAPVKGTSGKIGKTETKRAAEAAR